jgi:hypothetical protein
MTIGRIRQFASIPDGAQTPPNQWGANAPLLQYEGPG